VAWAPATPAEDIQARLTAAIETAVPGVTAYVRPLTFETYFARGIGEARFQGPIVTAFAILAGILAVVGVFGIVSFLVSQRTREFGIRLALGATRRNIQAAVIRESLLPAAGGVIAGSIGAWALARVVRSAVFEWDTSGGVAIAIVVVGLLLVATVAAFAPAVRASRVDPATSLRE
jgi:ABC-type antimicrobial peptide transport system permease subunit